MLLLFPVVLVQLCTGITVGYDDHGVRLPNAIIVKPAHAIMGEGSEDAVVDETNNQAESSFNLNADGTAADVPVEDATETTGETSVVDAENGTTEG